MSKNARHGLAALSLLLLSPSLLPGATISFDAPLHLKPDDASPAVATLPAGSSVTALLRSELEAEGVGPLPAGWIATRYSGPIFGYARNSDVGKDLALKPGSIVRSAPDETGLMVTMIGENERAEVVEVAGDWSKVVYTKSTILFFNSVPSAITRARGSSVETSAALPAEPEVEEPPAVSASAPASPRASAPPGPAVIDATPRVFQGYLMRTRRLLGVGPKLDYQLVDANGRRIALLDLGALLVTEPLDRFENREVTVFGPVSRLAEVKDLVIRVETLRLAK